MKLIYLIPLLLIGFYPVLGDTDFDALVPKIATQQHDLCILVWVFDDRWRSYNYPSSIRGALVNIEISLYGNTVESYYGYTHRGGYFGVCDFVTSGTYRQHALYKVDIYVDDKSKTFWFWTVRGRG